MFPCIYTKDKKKKLKKWEEGFYKYTNKKISLYDTDKKLICTKVTDLMEEIDTFKYIIYIENIYDNKSKDQIENNTDNEIECVPRKNSGMENLRTENIIYDLKEIYNIECKNEKEISDKTITKRTNNELLDILNIKK